MNSPLSSVIFPRELSRETYALLIFACSVHCPIERVAKEKFRIVSLSEKGKTFSIKEGDDFRRVFKLLIKAFLPSPDQRMQYLKRAEQYAEACLSAVDEMQENNSSLPLLSDILPSLNAAAESDQDGSDETAGAENEEPKGPPSTAVSAGSLAGLPAPNNENDETSASDDMTAEQKIEAIQRMLGISKMTREELERRENTIIELREQVRALKAQTDELQKDKEQAEEDKAKIRREYDDYKLKIRNFVLE